MTTFKQWLSRDPEAKRLMNELKPVEPKNWVAILWWKYSTGRLK